MNTNIGKQIGVGGANFDVDFDTLWSHEVLRRPCFELGVINKIKDSHASITFPNGKKSTDAEKAETYAKKLDQATKKLASLMKGELEMAGDGLGRATDPVGRFVRQIAESRIKTRLNGDANKLRELIGDRVKWDESSDEKSAESKRTALALLISDEMKLDIVREKATAMAKMFAEAMGDLSNAE